jgi:hypothetical protein
VLFVVLVTTKLPLAIVTSIYYIIVSTKDGPRDRQKLKVHLRKKML